MSLLNGPSEPIEFQPRGEDGPTYYLRVPTTGDEDRLIELVGEPVGFWPRVWALKAAIDRLEASGEFDAEFADWKELIDLYAERVREAAADDRRENSEASREAFNLAFQTPAPLDEIMDHVKHADPVFERLINSADTYRRRYGTAATRRFLVGWAGPGLGRLRRDPGGVIEDCLHLVPTEDRVAIGDRMNELFRPPPAKVGNSDSPSLPQSSPTISGPSRTMPQAQSQQPATAKRRRGRPPKAKAAAAEAEAAPAAVHSNGQTFEATPSTPAD